MCSVELDKAKAFYFIVLNSALPMTSVIMTEVTGRVHSVHLVNIHQRHLSIFLSDSTAVRHLIYGKSTEGQR